MSRTSSFVILFVTCCLSLRAVAAEPELPARVGLMIYWDHDVLAAGDGPGRFDADGWARAAKEAGFATLVVVARHGGGFCLWDSKVTAHDAVEATPLKRDVLRAAADACKRHGLRLGVVYSTADADPRTVLKPQSDELMAGYDPAWVWFVEDASRGERVRAEAGAPSRHSLDAALVTLNDSRGYRKDDNRWKPAGRVVEMLVERVGRGGDALLCVGPMPNGELPPQAAQRLAEVGRWMGVNGAAVRDVGPSPFKKLRHARATAAPGKVFLHVTFWPIDGRLVVPLKNKINKAYALATPAETYAVVAGEAPTLALPTATVGPLAMPKVVVVEIEGEPEAFEYVHRVRQGADGRLVLNATEGELTATNAKLEKKGTNPWNIGYWTNVADHVSWTAVVTKAGRYEIDVEYSVAPNSAGSEYRLEFGENHVEVKPAATKSFTDFTTSTVGTIELPAGEVVVTLRPTKKPGVAVMDLRKIELRPVP